eukprot:c18437_g3_i1.p1 GENE.c18437_g3_i1~~c18437_g3_i1.p1  ORF type:complete len:113 (-),score=25.16 c18437_g3_i1:122-460(-)
MKYISYITKSYPPSTQSKKQGIKIIDSETEINDLIDLFCSTTNNPVASDIVERLLEILPQNFLLISAATFHLASNQRQKQAIGILEPLCAKFPISSLASNIKQSFYQKFSQK